ncbi:alpha-L-fucosidase [Lutibacter citreus]|uniref:alpha-L-fucosidase n=1 Tax=Lutibacter citreus TaxID=2138210 RepID=UPI000DBE1C54|nr:alpha-L-fucosidase [Lutibacter citreus]
MKILKLTQISVMLLLFISVACSTEDKVVETNNGLYTEDWESLSQVNESPDWFQDAKLGIYTHWGPVSIANQGMKKGAGWYGLNMYMDSVVVDWKTGKPVEKNGKLSNQPSSVFEHHLKAHGHPSKFGYKDLIPLFQPDKFDAKEWAQLFKKAGAKFAGPVAMHHDNFAMWDSKVTRWNLKKTAGIDAVGDLKKEIEKNDMKFITSFHHAFTWVYFARAHFHDATKETYDLYTDPHSIENHKTSKRFQDEWFAKLKEVIDNYQPDIIWFDWWVEELDEAYRKKFVAYYYNKAKEWNKEVVINYKNNSFPAETGVNDYERGRPNKIKDKFWMTDTSPGAWFFRENAKYVSPNKIVDVLIDIVSKNGLMLLNVPPNPDGSIPSEVKELLINLGEWLNVNGEGIYSTRPWTVFGEGPTRIKGGGHKVENQKLEYKENDIRFTKKGDSLLFAYIMDTPTKDIKINSLGKKMTLLDGEITDIEILGSKEKVQWNINDDCLTIKKPLKIPNDLALGFKLKIKTVSEYGIGGEDDPE